MSCLEDFRKIHSKEFKNSVYCINEKPADKSFGDLYIKMRTLEGRLYDDSSLRKLPDIDKNHRHYKEWNIRKNSSEKLIKYLSGLKKQKLNIMELGCGNGWLANKISELNNTCVLGVDVNLLELEQAARVFGNKPNLIFAYADIFNSKLNDMKFDIIILASVLMYLPDINSLIDKLLGMLNPSGEIHIIDNVFYDESKIDSARKKTLEHYGLLGIPEMAVQVHHHLLNKLDKYNPQLIYNPHKFSERVKRKVFNSNSSPFVWMKIRN
jgi:SAM-dependent methyltransferase